MNNNTKKTVFMVSAVSVFCILMAITDANTTYLLKSAVKSMLFLILPIIYSFYDKDLKIKKIFMFNKKGIITAGILSVSVYLVIIGGYLLLKDVFDFSKITGALTKNTGVTVNNFIFISTYISFINSFLEEFFFRGFAFITLKRIAGRKFAYFFSAGAFAVYHIAMMTGWFKISVFLIVVAGLFAGGLIFNYLNEKSETIYPSWLVHMFANFAINTIGFMLFGIIG